VSTPSFLTKGVKTSFLGFPVLTSMYITFLRILFDGVHINCFNSFVIRYVCITMSASFPDTNQATA
jgi:hypothetical protein